MTPRSQPQWPVTFLLIGAGMRGNVRAASRDDADIHLGLRQLRSKTPRPCQSGRCSRSKSVAAEAGCEEACVSRRGST